MNVNASEFVDVDVVEEEIEDVVVTESEAEDQVTIPTHYLVHFKMELLFLKLIYILKVNTNHFTDTNKLQFNNSKFLLVGSMDISRLMDMFYMTKDTQLYQRV